MGTLDVVVSALHVVLGVAWAGGLFFVVLFLEPSVRAAGPAGGQVMGALQRRRFAPLMLAVAGVTLATGLYLYWRYATMSPAWMGSRWGITIALGALAGIVAFLIGFVVSRPTMARMGALMAGGPPSPEAMHEIERLQRRMRIAARAVAALLLLAVLAMGLARHV